MKNDHENRLWKITTSLETLVEDIVQEYEEKIGEVEDELQELEAAHTELKEYVERREEQIVSLAEQLALKENELYEALRAVEELKFQLAESNPSK